MRKAASLALLLAPLATAQSFVWTKSLEPLAGLSGLGIDPAGNPVVAGRSLLKLDAAAGSTLWVHATRSEGPLPSLAVDGLGGVHYTDIERASSTSPLFGYARKLGDGGQVLWENAFALVPSVVWPVAIDAQGNPVFGSSTPPYQFRPCVWTTGTWTLWRADGGTGAASPVGSRGTELVDPRIVVDRSRNAVAVAGRERVVNPNSCTYSVQSFGVLVKYRLDGSAGTRIVSESGFEPTALAVDGAGDLYVAGKEAARSEAVIRKYAGETSALLWSASIPGDSPTACMAPPEIRAIAIDPAGDVVVTGRSCDAIGGSNMRTVKFAGATGATLWTRPYAGSMPPFDAAAPDENGAGVVVDPQGDVLVVGTSADPADGPTLRVVKYRGDTGSQLWTLSYAGPAGTSSTGTLIARGSGSEVFVAGSSTPTGGGSVAIVGRIQDATPVLGVTPSPVLIGGQFFGSRSAPAAITIRNNGSAALSLSSVTTAAPFEVTHDCSTLAGGATCTAHVTYAPGEERPHVGSLAIATSAGNSAVILLGKGERSLVSLYYGSILRRLPDAGGRAYWEGEATRAAALGLDPNEVWYAMAAAFYGSPEYAAFARDDAGFVTDLYGTFLNRAPDPDGLAYWKAQVEAGMPRGVAQAFFMFSPEFLAFTRQLFGTGTVRAEVNAVTDFYRGFLSRLPDDGGFRYWLGEIRSRQCAGPLAPRQVSAVVDEISRSFINGPEYASRARDNAQFVGDLYNAFMRRGADLAGVRYWIDQLDSGARSREAVRQQFVSSPEFQARVQAIVDQGCLQP